MKIWEIDAVTAMLGAYDFLERHLVGHPVDFWRATLPYDALLLTMWPSLYERLERMRKWNIGVTILVSGIVIGVICWAEGIGLLPMIAPPIAAFGFGLSTLLAGAAVIAPLPGSMRCIVPIWRDVRWPRRERQRHERALTRVRSARTNE
jgi:hypothetical protein